MIELRRNTAEHLVWGGLQVVELGVLAGTAGLGALGWLAGIAHALATGVLLRRAMQRHRRTALGPADRVTLARNVLIGGITALVAEHAGTAAPIVVALGVVALLGDFLDGRVARRTGSVSAFGARLDMEVDAFLILVLSVHVAFAFGPWVLMIGALRYAFVAASWVLPRLRGELPPSFARKAVAALQGIALVVAASGLVPHARMLVALALAALVWSFGRDVAWLSRSRT
ncbi:CDP-alcohol phosphatidyltransferase family protein [Saccharopolyspora halophila]